jgi:hypothetical protein
MSKAGEVESSLSERPEEIGVGPVQVAQGVSIPRATRPLYPDGAFNSCQK